MAKNTNDALRLCLAGDWTVSGVAEQFPLLTQHLAHLLDSHSANTVQTDAAQVLPEVDLAGITALDACGCQLLVQFTLTLQQCGVSPRISNVPDAFSAKIRLLGFDRELKLSGETA